MAPLNIVMNCSYYWLHNITIHHNLRGGGADGSGGSGGAAGASTKNKIMTHGQISLDDLKEAKVLTNE